MKKNPKTEPPVLHVKGELRVTHTLDPDRTNNWLHMRFADTSVKVTEGDVQIGEISGCLGGAIEVVIGKNAYTISPKDLWEFMTQGIRNSE